MFANNTGQSNIVTLFSINFNIASLKLFAALQDLGAISLKLLGGKLAPKLVYFVLRKKLLTL